MPYFLSFTSNREWTMSNVTVMGRLKSQFYCVKRWTKRELLQSWQTISYGMLFANWCNSYYIIILRSYHIEPYNISLKTLFECTRRDSGYIQIFKPTKCSVVNLNRCMYTPVTSMWMLYHCANNFCTDGKDIELDVMEVGSNHLIKQSPINKNITANELTEPRTTQHFL